MHVTGSCIFRSPVPISKILSSNEFLLLAVGGRGEFGFNKLCGKLKSITGL